MALLAAHFVIDAFNVLDHINDLKLRIFLSLVRVGAHQFGLGGQVHDAAVLLGLML